MNRNEVNMKLGFHFFFFFRTSVVLIPVLLNVIEFNNLIFKITASKYLREKCNRRSNYAHACLPLLLSTCDLLLNLNIIHQKHHYNHGSYNDTYDFYFVFFSHHYALLFHGDNIPGHSTTNGPIGKETTLSLLMQEILDLKAQDKCQEQEIQTLKNQTLSKDNVTASTVNKLASEYMDMKNAFGLMKQKIDQNNSQTELQTLKSRVDTIAQSIRYLTLSLQSHEIHDEETNMTIHREFEHIIMISYKLMNEIQKVHNYTVSESKDIHDLLTVQQGRILTLRSELASLKHLNSKLMNENKKLHEEILNLTNIESSDIQRLETIQQTTFTSLASEIATQKTKLRNLNNNLLLHFDYSKYHIIAGLLV